jgi:hypothetical protein
MDNSRVKGIRPLRLLFALTVLVCMMLTAPAAAEEALPDRVYVNASYNDETPDYGYLNFSSIQEAIDGVAEGGEVWVYNGTYAENLVIDKSVNATAVPELLDPDYRPIIDAMGEDVGIEIIADNVSFSGFGVVNASAVGIHAHGASAVTIEHNAVAVSNDTYDETHGIFVEDGAGIAILSNQVRVIGSSTQMGVAIEGVDEAYVYDNEIVAVARLLTPEGVGMEANPVVTASVTEEDEPLFAADAVDLARIGMEPNGIWICDSAPVAIESNRVVAVGACTADDPALYYSVVDAWGIRSCTWENIKILENNVTVVGTAANLSRTAGIYGAGDLTLIEGNTVETYTMAREVQPVGIRLGYADKGQVLDNFVDMEVECAGTTGNDGLRRAAGIIAFDSYKAQVLQNTVSFTLAATGPVEACQVQAEGVYIELCDESRVSENIVIVESVLIREQTCDDSVEAETPLWAPSSVTGIVVRVSDEPEILENVVHAFGAVGAFDGKTAPDDSIQSVAEELAMTGIWVRGGSIKNPVVAENVVLVDAQTIGIAGPGAYFAETQAVIADNSDLAGRYAAVMQDRQEGTSTAACLQAYLADVDGLSAVTERDLEFTPEIEDIALVEVYVTTEGILLEGVLDPIVCYNHVLVYQDSTVIISDLLLRGGEEGILTNTMPAGLIGQAFSGEQIGQAAVLSLINENGSEWQSLSEADRTAITDAVIAGDAGVLAAYTEDETLFTADSGLADAIDRYQALLENEDSFGFLNATRLAAAVPVSVSYGLLYDAEGDAEVYENNFTVRTTTINLVITEGDNLDVPDAAAGSAGLVTAFGVSGTSDSIEVADNLINVDTQGVYLNMARGGEIATSDAAAGTAHLLLAVGVSADAEDEHILNNNITVRQRTSAQAQAINRVKDEMALSVAATAGVGIGIVLDASEVLDPETYEPAPPNPDEWFADVIQGNTVSVTNEILVEAIAAMLLPAPLDGSSNALSAAVGAAASFGIVAPEADVLDNVVNTTANQRSIAAAFVEEDTAYPATLAAEIDLPGTGAANLGIAASGGILTLRSYMENNTVYTVADSEVEVEAETEELLEDAGIFGGAVAVDIGIVSLSPSYIDGNTVDGAGSLILMGMVGGDRVDIEGLFLALDLGILSRGSDATFNNIHNGYLGLPYYYEEEEYEPYAFYNWWGDASGPSGFGPGTGSPVTGTMNYEPWLTQPADVVLETGKSYFGLEIGSPNIGGDGYRDGLEPGWNTLSFPLALENNTWQAVTHAGDGLNYSVACTWDAAGQRWVQVTGASRINPLDAVYIRMNDYDRLAVAISPEITNPPTRALKAGWNLIGPAYDLKNGPIEVPACYLWWGEPYGTSVKKALVSVEKTPTGLTGYNVVVSPSINPESWVYIPGDGAEPDMDATCGYWVYMENPDELAGFSTTPLPMPNWAWDL